MHPPEELGEDLTPIPRRAREAGSCRDRFSE